MKRPARNGDEQDCFYARKHYHYFHKAGRASAIKRRARRRERHLEKQLTQARAIAEAIHPYDPAQRELPWRNNSTNQH